MKASATGGGACDEEIAFADDSFCCTFLAACVRSTRARRPAAIPLSGVLLSI
jgi:hypothetical protein